MLVLFSQVPASTFYMQLVINMQIPRYGIEIDCTLTVECV